MSKRDRIDDPGFLEFLRVVEPRLREALIATYGPVDGREAAVDALSWAWEHRSTLDSITNPVGYLYRVGQSATRRFAARSLPLIVEQAVAKEAPDIDPGLRPALDRLSSQQRACVLLVCAFEWRQSEVADILGIQPPTVRTHLTRALARLRAELEAADAPRP